MSNKTETTASTWAATICVGLVLLFGWVKCKGDSASSACSEQAESAVFNRRCYQPNTRREMTREHNELHQSDVLSVYVTRR